MSEEVAVIIKATPDVAEALLKIIPGAIIRKIKQKEMPLVEEKNPVKTDTVEDREKLLREIIMFCRERKSPVDAMRFFNYYDARGWVDNRGKKIDDWKAKLIEWESNGNANKKRSYTTAAEYEAMQKYPTEEEKKSFTKDIEWMADFVKRGGKSEA